MPHIRIGSPGATGTVLRRLSSRRRWVAAFVALPVATLALAAAGCGLSKDDEVAMGRENSAKVEQQVPLVRDPVAARYLDSLGQAIARGADQRGLAWQFRLVESDEVNAFSLPGGFVYVNRGLVARSATKSELAGVLAHEIGHVTMRHGVKQLEKAQRTGMGVTLLCTLTDVCDNDVGRAAVRVGGSALMARYSRADELQADSVAVGYVVDAGIDPDGIPRLFRRLMQERAAEPDVVDAWFGTHPMEEDRIAQAERLIAATEHGFPPNLVTDDETYQRFRARLLPAAR